MNRTMTRAQWYADYRRCRILAKLVCYQMRVPVGTVSVLPNIGRYDGFFSGPGVVSTEPNPESKPNRPPD